MFLLGKQLPINNVVRCPPVWESGDTPNVQRTQLPTVKVYGWA